MPWGALTGIRPTKLAYMETDEGGDWLSLFEKMRVSPENISLVSDILRSQKGIYEKKNGNTDYFVSLPFCPTKCAYCSFITAPIEKTRHFLPEYLDKLEREVFETADLIGNLRSIYIGGGTPFALDAPDLERVLKATSKIQKSGVEYTVEAGRPDVFSDEKLKLLKDYGVTRICINPQSFSDETLEKIGRKHTVADVYKAFETSEKYGFDTNIDLIAGLADEAPETFIKSVEKAVALNADNITVHCLSLKSGAKLKEEVSRIENDFISTMVAASREILYNVNGVEVSASNFSSGDSIVAVGGIVGATIDADVYESKNTGTVLGEYAYAGGIAGIAVSDTGVHYVECCDNEGAVSSAYGVAGGIVGRAVAAGEGYVSIKLNVQECNNAGSVSGNAYGEVAGETATVESAQVIIGEELSSYSGTCSANNATYITADAVQYGTKATGSVTPNGSATGTQIAGTNRWILRYRGRTTDLPSKPVMVTLITVTDASKVEILSVDVSGLSYVDGRITGNVIVEVYRPEGDVTAYDVVAGTSVGKKFADVDFASVSGSDRITHVTVPVNCAADAGEIIVNAMVVDDTETMNPVCENKYGE